MAKFASDTFTGVDGTTLQAHSANWIEHPSSAGGDMLITSNRLQQRVVGEGFYYHSASPSSANYSVSSDFYVVSYSPAFNASGVIGRTSTTANTFYHARHRISGGWELYKRVTGTFTLLGSQTISTPAVGGTYNLKLDMAGSTIRLLADGVELVSVADASITAAGKAGLRISNASAQTTTEGFHFDNFSADDSGAASSQEITSVVATASAGSATPSVTPGAVILGVVAVSGAAAVATPQIQTGTGVLSPLAAHADAATETPQLLAGVISLNPPVVSVGAATATPTLLLGSTNLTPTAVTAQGGVVTPILLNGVQIEVPGVSAQAAVSSPSLTAGTTSLTPSAPQIEATVRAPSLSPGNVEITAVPAIVAAGVATPSLSSGSTLQPAVVTGSAQTVAVELSSSAVDLLVDRVTGEARPSIPLFQLSALSLVYGAVAATAEVRVPSLLNEGEGVNLDRLYSIAAENRFYSVLGEVREYTI